MFKMLRRLCVIDCSFIYSIILENVNDRLKSRGREGSTGKGREMGGREEVRESRCNLLRGYIMLASSRLT